MKYRYNYKVSYTSRSGNDKVTLSKTKESAEKLKSNMVKSNKLHRRTGYPIGYKNPRVSKIRRSK